MLCAPRDPRILAELWSAMFGCKSQACCFHARISHPKYEAGKLPVRGVVLPHPKEGSWRSPANSIDSARGEDAPPQVRSRASGSVVRQPWPPPQLGPRSHHWQERRRNTHIVACWLHARLKWRGSRGPQLVSKAVKLEASFLAAANVQPSIPGHLLKPLSDK